MHNLPQFTRKRKYGECGGQLASHLIRYSDPWLAADNLLKRITITASWLMEWQFEQWKTDKDPAPFSDYGDKEMGNLCRHVTNTGHLAHRSMISVFFSFLPVKRVKCELAMHEPWQQNQSRLRMDVSISLKMHKAYLSWQWQLNMTID